MKPSPGLLTPYNHVLVLIDFEGQMAFATKSISISELRTNRAIVSTRFIQGVGTLGLIR